MKTVFKNVVIIIITVFSVISCNQVEETTMDDFIVVEIDNINLTSKSIGMAFKEAHDGILFASINEADFDDFDNIASRVKVNQKLKIKGIIHDFNHNKKMFSPKSDSLTAGIISVKEIIYLD